MRSPAGALASEVSAEPHQFLHLRRDGHGFTGQDRHKPFRGPRPLACIVDPGERLERNGIADVL